MLPIILKFIAPYYVFAATATFPLVHNLNALGILSYWQGAYIAPHSLFLNCSMLYLLALVLVGVFNIFSAFSLSKKLTIFLLILWFTPGILSVLGLLEFKIQSPDKYILSDGVLYVGELRGTLFNVLISFILGWSTITLSRYILNVGSWFKNSYDHLWYICGLTAAAFFVVGSNASYYNQQLAESEKYIQNSLNILQRQFKYTDSICSSELATLEKHGVSKEFCSWVKKAKFKVWWLSSEQDFTRQHSQRPTTNTFLSLRNTEKISKENLLTEINNFNNYVCASPQLQNNCEMIPFSLNGNLYDTQSISNKYILAIRPLLPTLERYWAESIKTLNKAKESQRIPNLKWLFYILIGFIAGGKVANSSNSLICSPRERNIYRKTLIKLTKQILCIFKIK